jgi:hypothetical protein
MDVGKLRVAIDHMDREIAVLVRRLPEEASGLPVAWAGLVGALAIEPAPAMRNCPRCGEAGMRDATICGYCWLKLAPPGTEPEGASRDAR